jgi:hypothetical protein
VSLVLEIRGDALSLRLSGKDEPDPDGVAERIRKAAGA